MANDALSAGAGFAQGFAGAFNPMMERKQAMEENARQRKLEMEAAAQMRAEALGERRQEQFMAPEEFEVTADILDPKGKGTHKIGASIQRNAAATILGNLGTNARPPRPATPRAPGGGGSKPSKIDREAIKAKALVNVYRTVGKKPGDMTLKAPQVQALNEQARAAANAEIANLNKISGAPVALFDQPWTQVMPKTGWFGQEEVAPYSQGGEAKPALDEIFK